MRKNVIVVICIFFSISGICQVTNYPKKILQTNFQRVVFKIEDSSSYRFTIFIKPEGQFYFKEGFLDSSYKDNKTFYKIDKRQVVEQINMKYIYRNSVCSINTRFPFKEIKDGKNSILNIIDELEYSYILQQLGESKLNANNDDIRLIYPCDDINECNEFHVVKVRFYNDSAMLYHIFGYSNDTSGIRKVSQDSCLLKAKDIKIIRKLLAETTDTTFCECRRPGNPWILESNIQGKYSHKIISYYCQRGKGEFKSITNFNYLLRELNKRYFKSYRCTTKVPPARRSL